MDKIVVMITALGDWIGMSILKALRMSGIESHIIGTDINPLSAGLFMADESYTIPHVSKDSRKYLDEISEICLEHKVKTIFVGSEPELRVLAAHREKIEKETGTLVVVNKLNVIETASDKWELVKFLKKNGLPAPDSILPTKSDEVTKFIEQYGFPLIVKPRVSTGSKGLFMVQNRKELEAALVFTKDAVIQEYLQPDHEEYTVGVFMTPKGEYFSSIIFRRWLSKGLTSKAIVTKNPEIEKVSREAALAIGAVGPINIQLRLTERGPVIFEINPRISSSSVMRAYFGFNEPEMVIRSFLLKGDLILPKIKEGTALRYWEEMYLP